MFNDFQYGYYVKAGSVKRQFINCIDIELDVIPRTIVFKFRILDVYACDTL